MDVHLLYYKIRFYILYVLLNKPSEENEFEWIIKYMIRVEI